MPNIDLSILNQRQTPAFFASSLATRPAFGFAGRIFIDSDVPSTGLYRDTGSAWVQIADPGAGSTGTLQQVTTNGNTTSQGITITAGGLNANNISLAQNTGTVKTSAFSQIMATNDIFEIYGIGTAAGLGQGEMIFSLGDDGSPFASGGERFRFTYGSNIVTGTAKDVFIVDYDLSYFNTSLGINTDTPTAAFDVHSGVSVIAQLNQTVATNNSLLAFQNAGSGLWRVGNFYNSGANDFGVFDVVGAIQPVIIKKTTGQVLIGTSTVGSGKLVVASSTGDNGVQIVGAAAPSLRIDNAESGPTKRVGLGISTAANNFIQGSVDRDFCIFNGSTTASPILFGIYDTTNVAEAARISAARNFIVGKTTDSGERLQISGTTLLSGNTTITSSTSNQLSLNGGTTVQSRILIARGSDDSAQNMSIGYSNITTIRSNVPLASPQTDFSLNQQGSDGTRTVLYMSSAGNIGVQTNAPAVPLEVLAINEGEYFRGGGGTISGRSLRFSNYTIGGTVGIGHRINNPNSGGSLNFAINSNDAIIIRNTGNVLINTTNDSGDKLQVNGNINISALSTLHVESDNVTTSSTQVSEGGIGVGAFYFAAWFNNIGGAQGVATLMARGSTVVIVSISDGSGAAVSFTASSGTLFAQTTVGSVTMAVTQIKL
jgi:hypothetical protein